MEVIYTNHIGESINLSQWPVMLLEPEALFGNDWSYSTTDSGKIDQFYMEGKDREVVVQIFADSEEEYKQVLNDITQVTEKDVNKLNPGCLTIGEYYLPCYIVGWSYEDYEEDFYSTNKTVKIRADKWAWNCTNETSFVYQEAVDEGGRGYPYGYDYDYSVGRGCLKMLNNTHFAPADFIMIINGYALNPSITIGNNNYHVNATVQVGETLTIDSKERKIFLTKNNGVQVNCFAKRGGNDYFFKKIEPGENQVYWNGEFDIDITLCEERSEPKWT